MMFTTIFLLCLTAGTFGLSDDSVQGFQLSKNPIKGWIPGAYGTCPEGAVWSKCLGHYLKTCKVPNPKYNIDPHRCVPGCVCPVGQFLDQWNRCGREEICWLRYAYTTDEK